MINDYIRDLYWYYRRIIVFKDIFDPKEDENAINQIAISAISAELNISKEMIAEVLGLQN